MQAERVCGYAWRSICVTGATSQLATFLLPRLRQEGVAVHAFGRNPPAASAADINWHAVDIGGADPLPRIQAEARLAAECDRYGIAWTFLRPTFTYGDGQDKNIARIAAFIRRFVFSPIAGPANGRRQSVHAADLAAACHIALDCPAALRPAYNLAGGEVLTYRELVEAIFRAQGKTPFIIRLPLMMWRLAAHFSRLLGSNVAINMGMVRRMNADLVFDDAEARRDLGYAPRAFRP